MKNLGNLLTFLSLFGAWTLSPVNAKPLKVFVLCGQSNMEGHAKISTFEVMKMDPLTKLILEEMIDGKGNPVVCDQVWISYFTGGGDNSQRVSHSPNPIFFPISKRTQRKQKI